MFKNPVLLGLCQFLLMISAAVGISFNGLVGEHLAASPALATMPFLSMSATTAILVLMLPSIFARLGYRRTFALGAALGVLGSLLAAVAIWFGSFALFCCAGFFMGSYQASALYYRFAAADSVEPPHKSTAIAWVLNGGILAALLGPLLASKSVHWLSVDYLGSYLSVATLGLLALPVMMFLQLPKRHAVSASVQIPLTTLLKIPAALVAILFCAGGYAMMMLVMLASPLAMHGCGFVAQDAASVIQWHLLGMFVPSLLTGKLIARYGAIPIALIGCAILTVGCGVAVAGMELIHFHWALMLVGVGWNFMYMGGSTLITQVDISVRPRLQAMNEFITFAVMTLTAGATGWLYQYLGWKALLQMAVVFVVILVLFVLMDRWRAKTKLKALNANS